MFPGSHSVANEYALRRLESDESVMDSIGVLVVVAALGIGSLEPKEMVTRRGS